MASYVITWQDVDCGPFDIYNSVHNNLVALQAALELDPTKPSKLWDRNEDSDDNSGMMLYCTIHVRIGSETEFEVELARDSAPTMQEIEALFGTCYIVNSFDDEGDAVHFIPDKNATTVDELYCFHANDFCGLYPGSQDIELIIDEEVVLYNETIDGGFIGKTIYIRKKRGPAQEPEGKE